MTHIYFVRHAQPVKGWVDDKTRPLAAEGVEDSKLVTEFMKVMKLDYAISSPYIRSVDTIKECVEQHSLVLHTDERFRERQNGKCEISEAMITKRWENKDYHEEDGESLNELQKRNIEALLEVLLNHDGENIILGTHGSALSSILNYYDSDFCCNDFLKIIDYRPYIIRLDFEGTEYVGKEELLIVDKGLTYES